MLDVRRLRVLHAVSAYGSVTAAAAALGYTAPAVSQQLAALERERFARDPRAYPGAADDTRDLVAGVFATVTTRARIIAVLFPPSLWARITRRPAAP